MRNILLLLLIFLGVPSASAELKGGEGTYFQGKDGCFLLYNMKTGAFEKVIGEGRCRERFSPCSTFKIPLAVMAFDAGILKDESEVLKWDGKKNPREVANHDHNARTWMQDSIVWFSQRLTPRLGETRFRKYLHAFHYGNKDISGGLTQAWLVPPDAKGPALKISAYEQVVFMKNLWTNKLKVSPHAMTMTKDITYLETSPKGFRLSGKTGSNSYDSNMKIRIGWFVAHIDNGTKEYIAVANFTDRLPTDETSSGGPKAKEITKKILDDQGLW
ncbi:MAG: penicillin-binding transpeptidase domain-containing protein [Candidatus Omnitrophota bacterium]